MRLFISYARVDKYFCTQIIDLLDVHDVWYDHRLHAGQQWWDEILKELEWCEGVVYLLSPDSASSEYCQRELSIAQSLGKHIFPVLIQARTVMPDALKHIQYADLSGGLTTEGVKSLLNSIYVAERAASRPVPAVAAAAVAAPPNAVFVEPAKQDASAVIYDAADAMQNGEYDRAVFLLKQVKANGFESRYIDLSAMLHEAEHALEWQAYLREAEREYAPIAALIKRERTRKLGVQAFRGFQKNFPDYDPENLASYCSTTSENSLLEWCEIPGGLVKVGEFAPVEITGFRMGKYPVTNAQFQEFIDAADGYTNSVWWEFSPHARKWFLEHPQPLPVKLIGHNHPCVNVSWYEAVAFCAWLSSQTGLHITLPTEQQWQRAAQGDDGRLYPWGSDFEVSRSNSKEAGNRMTVPVTQYPNGISPYGVFDMAGNTWEWCLNTETGTDMTNDAHRVMRGGSYISPHNRIQCGFSFALNPQCRYETIGFRIICQM